MIKVKIDKSTFSVEKGISLSTLLSEHKGDRKPVFARVDGHLVGLDHLLDKETEIEWVYPESQEALDILRHSTAHLMAQAVLELFPGTQTGIGPAIEDGFFYDFLRETPFTPEDLQVIEKKMRELSDQGFHIDRQVLPKTEALEMFRERGHDLKEELIQEKGQEKVSCFRQGNFVDFCLGPHVPTTKAIKHFKLLSVSGAYWKGDEKGKQLQRIYGTVFFTQKELKEYLNLLEEAKKRDHRKLGVELDLFSFNENLGAGLILWHPKGARVRCLIEDFWREEHFNAGYDILYSPHIAKLNVWEKSGHTEFYDAMYPTFESDGVEYELKPMNCPFHIMVYNSRQRSYRDLPLRWAELGTVYRYERSGVLHGLMRVRGFTQDDAHIFCRDDQLSDEVIKATRLALSFLKAFGFDDYDVFLSTRPEKYVGEIKDWEKATESLETALKDVGLEYRVDLGEGVFYGPKIDIKIKDALRRSWQCTTIQLDFNLAERFDIHYVGEDGKTHRPFLVHRALLGSLERFFGILIEQFNGSFPVWLSPIQVSVLPIADRHNDYARTVNDVLRQNGLRTQIDDRREKTGYKIRQAETQKIPLILVVGDKEIEAQNVSLRIHTKGDVGQVTLNDFLEKVKKLIENKALTLDL